MNDFGAALYMHTKALLSTDVQVLKIIAEYNGVSHPHFSTRANIVFNTHADKEYNSSTANVPLLRSLVIMAVYIHSQWTRLLKLTSFHNYSRDTCRWAPK